MALTRLRHVLLYRHCNLAFADVYSKLWSAAMNYTNVTLPRSTGVGAMPHWPHFNLDHKHLNATPRLLHPERSRHSAIRGGLWNSIPTCGKIRIVLFGADSYGGLLIPRLWFIKKPNSVLSHCGCLVDLCQVHFLYVKKNVSFWAGLVVRSWQKATPSIYLSSSLFHPKLITAQVWGLRGERLTSHGLHCGKSNSREKFHPEGDF